MNLGGATIVSRSLRMGKRFRATKLATQPSIKATSLSTAACTPGTQVVDKAVGYWLLGTGALVGCMVSVGGLTRLTKSGLSMTDWKVQGSLPPQTQDEWEKEFERYKQFPEWQQRKSMTLDEFKYIFYWEWGHRALGRALGLAYCLPLALFAARGRLRPDLRPKLAALLGLGGTQGLVGWWMVRSGLEGVDPRQRKEIRVSPYRLAAHLGMAFTTGTLLLWTGLEALAAPGAAAAAARQLLEAGPPEALRGVRRVRSLGLAALPLIFATALSGAFVAGNDAGCAYNTWPKMDEEWVPSEILDMKPLWRNFFENTATVQFDHRMLAYSTTAAIGLTYAAARRGPVWGALPADARRSLAGLAGMVGVQASLGVATLLSHVPIELAATHQAGSLVLLGLGTKFVHSMRFAAARHTAAAAAAATAGRAGAAAAGRAGATVPKAVPP
mmetsp:Transcript_12973/g.21291  ORF Transcript_12973/g.21291 Transcript_12973/m.21291 type:complete len:442 (-) Transcript_12973:346-1671(-)